MNEHEAEVAVERGLTEYKERVLPDNSLLCFELADLGTLTKKGEPRKRPHRAYYHTSAGFDNSMMEVTLKGADTPPEVKMRRMRQTSVTTILDSILPKPGLPPWAEKQGIMGAHEAFQRGDISTGYGCVLQDYCSEPEDWVRIVRENNLGADAARDLAATRGLNVHALLEQYMRTGTPPDKREHPEYHHGFIQGLCSFLLDYDPEPEAVETLVCDPERGYAGRRDLISRIGGRRVGTDLKTQPNAGIYASAHVQLRMYEDADVNFCGGEPCDALEVVVIAENGEYRVMPCEATSETVDRALAFYELLHPIDLLCESANRREKAARA